jgi:hypothetical protein
MQTTLKTLRTFLLACRPARATIALGFLLILGFAQSDLAQSTPPLNFANNFFVTGDYVVAGAYGMNNTFQNINAFGYTEGYTTGAIPVPDLANPSNSSQKNTGNTGATSVPTGAQIVAALLYWETVEFASTTTGQAGSGQNGFFGVKGGTSYAISGVNLNPQGTVAWSSGGCPSTSTGKVVRAYRANVASLLPQDANGNVLANQTYQVTLPSGSSASPPVSLGATLVIIYRVLSPSFPLNSIVIYDGAYGQSTANPPSSLIMTQTVQGFYEAATNPVSRLTHIVGSGQANKNQTVYLDNVPLPSLYPATPLAAFPGWYGDWDNPTWTFGDPNYPSPTNPVGPTAFSNPVQAGDSSAITQVVPATSQQGCVAWGATIVSTTVNANSADGLLDVWKKSGGYCDAAIGGGVCTRGDTSSGWVPLDDPNDHPVVGRQDIFVQLDYMTDASGNPLLDQPTVNSAVTMVQNAFLGFAENYLQNNSHKVHLHVFTGNAIKEDTCVDNTTVPGQLCSFPVQPGVVGWKAGFAFLKNQDLTTGAVCSPPYTGCTPRFLHGMKDSWHYVMLAHAPGLTKWSIVGGTLSSVTQSGNFVTFTTSTPHGPLNFVGVKGVNTAVDPSCGDGGRVTVVGATSNLNLNGTYCIQSSSDTTFTINIGSSSPATNPTGPYTLQTDPNLAVAPGYVTTTSGVSDVGGDDSLITLVTWGADATLNVIKGTIAHELAHSLGLTHGGFSFLNPTGTPPDYTPVVEANCKPNFQSVMSYSRQFDLLHYLTGYDQNGNPILLSVVDYSEQALDTLNENSASSSPVFTTNPFYFDTSWYAPTDVVGGTSATLHCDGTPIPAGATNYSLVTGPAVPPQTGLCLSCSPPLSWAADQDINFDGLLNPTPPTIPAMNGYNDWAKLDLRQMGASGSASSAGNGLAGTGNGLAGTGNGLAGTGNGLAGTGNGLAGTGGEITNETANSVTRPPTNLTATEDQSPRYIHLFWYPPSFGQIGTYNIYRQPRFASGNPLSVPVSQLTFIPATGQYEFTDTTVTCNPSGYTYSVSAVLVNTTQESVKSNTVPASGQAALTGCYTNTPGQSVILNPVSFSTNAVSVKTQVPITWSFQDDNLYNGAYPYVNNKLANSLVAIGPTPYSSSTKTCGAIQSGTMSRPLLTNGIVNSNLPSKSAFGVSSQSPYLFTFTWNTTGFSSGCYYFKLTLDSNQTCTPSSQCSTSGVTTSAVPLK